MKIQGPTQYRSQITSMNEYSGSGNAETNVKQCKLRTKINKKIQTPCQKNTKSNQMKNRYIINPVLKSTQIESLVQDKCSSHVKSMQNEGQTQYKSSTEINAK